MLSELKVGCLLFDEGESRLFIKNSSVLSLLAQSLTALGMCPVSLGKEEMKRDKE